MLQLKANSHWVGDKAFLEYQNLAQNISSITVAFPEHTLSLSNFFIKDQSFERCFLNSLASFILYRYTLDGNMVYVYNSNIEVILARAEEAR